MPHGILDALYSFDNDTVTYAENHAIGLFHYDAMVCLHE